MDSLLLLFTVAKSFLAILLLQFIKLFNLSHPPGRHSLKNEVDNMFATSSQGCLCGIDYVTNNLKIYLCWCFWFGLATEVRRPSLGWIWTDIKWNGKIDRWSRGKSLSLLVAHRATQCISMFLCLSVSLAQCFKFKQLSCVCWLQRILFCFSSVFCGIVWPISPNHLVNLPCLGSMKLQWSYLFLCLPKSQSLSW